MNLSHTRRVLLTGLGAATGLAILDRARAADSAPAFVDVAGHLPPLKFRMEDVASGTIVTQAAFRGHPVILYFGFTRCPDSCPLTMQNAARLVTKLGKQGQALRVLFVTVDLEYDTAPRLKAFMAQFGAPPIFVGLRATPAELKATAKRYGVFYQAPTGSDTPDPVSGIGHSSATYLFAPDGRAKAVLPALPTSAPKLNDDAGLIRKLMASA